MNELQKWVLNELAPNDKKITTIVAIFPGRFQPFHKDHFAKYEWAAKKFGKDNTYIATSNVVALPKSPFSFNEKKKIINSYGVKNVVQVKNPYKAEEVLSKYDPETTAAVFVVGQKDASRLGGKFFRPWKGKAEVGYRDGAYTLIAPELRGSEYSGTQVRQLLGGDTPNKKEIFKKIFGHTKPEIYNLVVGKLEGVKETINKFINRPVTQRLLREVSYGNQLQGSDVDDGPRYFYGHRNAYETNTKEMAERLGYEILDYILGDTDTMDFRNPYPKGPVRAVSYFPSGVPGEHTPTNQQDYKGTKAYKMWRKHISRFATSLGWQFVNWMDAEESIDDSKTEPNTVTSTTSKLKESVLREVESNLDKELSYKDDSGETKKITARAALRQGKDHPAYKDALAIKKQVDKETEKDTEREKTDKQKDKEDEKGKEKQKDTSKPVSDKDKQQAAKNLGYNKPEDMLTPGEKKTVEFEPDEAMPKDTEFKADKKLLDKINSAKEKLKGWSDKQKKELREVPTAKRSVGEAILNKLKKAPGQVLGMIKHKVHNYQHVAGLAGDLIMGNKPGDNEVVHFKSKSGQKMSAKVKDIQANPNQYSKQVQQTANDVKHKAVKHAKKELALFALDTAIVTGMVAAGPAVAGAALGKAVVSNLATLWAKDSILLGVGRSALFAGKENDSEEKAVEHLVKHFATWLQTKKLSQEDYLDMINGMDNETNEDFMPNPMEDPKWKNDETDEVTPLFRKGVDGTVAVTARESVSKDYWKKIFEGIELPVEIGDTVYMGKFKNKPVKVTDISWNDKGDLLINGKPALKMRIPNKTNVFGNDSRYTNEAKDIYDKFLDNPTKPTGRAKTLIAKFIKQYGTDASQMAVERFAKQNNLTPEEKYILKYITRQDVKITSKAGGPDFSIFTEGLLTEGGAFGHVSHPFDEADLTFGELKRLITMALSGELSKETKVMEKMDGQQLSVTWHNGKLKAARNKTELKGFGANALDAKSVASKFAGRGEISNSFKFAMQDMEKAVKSLSDKKREEIFKNGKVFLSMEIIWPGTTNVINYDKALLVVHGSQVEYDESGAPVRYINGVASELVKAIQSVNANLQKRFEIIEQPVIDLPKHINFGAKQSEFLSKLDKIKSTFGLKDTDTLMMYHQMWWEQFITKQAESMGVSLSNNTLVGLTKRWAFDDKSYTAKDMKRDITDVKFLDWVTNYDKKEKGEQLKKNLLPFEQLFFELGVEILKNLKQFLTASPDKAVQQIRGELDKNISDIKKGGDISKLNILTRQLDKIANIQDKVMPSEGLIFLYYPKGSTEPKTIKLTGGFGPINAILGILKFSR